MSARDGKDKAASPFRQESLDRAKSPEQLDDYIRVSNPGVWMGRGAVLLLLLAGLIGACCGRLSTRCLLRWWCKAATRPATSPRTR